MNALKRQSKQQQQRKSVVGGVWMKDGFKNIVKG